MTEFEYRPQAGVDIVWMLTLSGYSGDIDGLDGDFDPLDALSDIEATIENFEGEYQQTSGSSIVRVSGGHGWRMYEWANGKAHRYEWHLHDYDLRCPSCRRPEVAKIYMVTNELWDSSGLNSSECYRCLEAAIGRELVPADFQLEILCNHDSEVRDPELRRRMGYR